MAFSSWYTRLLQIRPAERSLVWWSFLLSTLVGIPRLFSMTLGNALFLSRFSASYLPLVYLGSAILNPIVGVIYLALEKRFSFRTLQNSALGLLVGASGVLAGLIYGLADPGIGGAALLVWLDIEWTLTNLILWGTLNRMYTVEQSKRLYGVAGSGEILVMVLGGLISGPLVIFLGVRSLIFFSLFGFLCMAPVLNGLLSRHSSGEGETIGPAKEGSEKTRLGSFPWLLIFFFGIFQYGVYFFGDTIFYMEAERTYRSAEELAGFFGSYFPVLGVLTLGFKVFFSGRIIPGLGLRRSLFLTPLGLGGFAVLVGVFGGLGPAVGLRLFQAVFFSGLVYPVFYSLMQPLAPRQRSRVQTLSELVYGPMVGVVVSLGLFALTGYFGLGAGVLGFLLVGVTAGWLVLSRKMFLAYTFALDRAMDGGVFLSKTEALDEAALQQIGATVSRDSAELVGVKLEILQTSGYPKIYQVYRDLWSHKDPELRKNGYRNSVRQLLDLRKDEQKVLVQRETDSEGRKVLVGILASQNQLPDFDAWNLRPEEQTIVDLAKEFLQVDPDFFLSAFDLPENRQLLDGAQYLYRTEICHLGLRVLLGVEDLSRSPEIFSWFEDWLSSKAPLTDIWAPVGLRAFSRDELRQLPEARITVRRLLGILGRSGGSSGVPYLLAGAEHYEAGLRGTALSLAYRLSLRATPGSLGLSDEGIVRLVTGIQEDIYHLFSPESLEFKDPHIKAAWNELLSGLVGQVFLLLGMRYPQAGIDSLERTFSTGIPERRALVLERIESLVDSGLWTLLQPLFGQVLNPVPGTRGSLEALGVPGSWLGYLLHPEKGQKSRADAAEVLDTLELFQFVSPGQLWYLARDLKAHSFDRDTEVIRKGEIGTSLFISVRGRARVEKSEDLVFDLEEGAVLGEFAALDNEPRSARVIAPKGGFWYELGQESLFDAVQGNPELALAILGALGRKVRMSGKGESLDRGNWYPSPGRSLGLIQRVQLLSQVPLFSRLDSEALLYLARGLGEFERRSGQPLVSRGEGLSGVVILGSGSLVYPNRGVRIAPSEIGVFGQVRIFDRSIEGEGESEALIAGKELFGFQVSKRLLDSLVWTRPEVLSSLAKPYLEVLRTED